MVNTNILLWADSFPWMGIYKIDTMEDYYNEGQQMYLNSLYGCDEGYGDEDYLSDYEYGNGYFSDDSELLSTSEAYDTSENDYFLPKDAESFLNFVFPLDKLPTIEEFYSTRPWKLLGVGKEEFRTMSDIYCNTFKLGKENFIEFLSACISDEAQYFTDICERTRYAIIIALYSNKIEAEDPKEWMKLIKKVRKEDLEHTLQLYSDYKDAIRTIDSFNHDICKIEEPVLILDEWLVDLSKYDKHIKLSNLKDLHDKATRKATECRRILDGFENEHLNEDVKATVDSIAYKQFLYDGRDYSIMPVIEASDLDREGEVLNHCVASYKSALADGESLIYFLRDTNNPNTPLFTLEIINDLFGYTLNQCYGIDDTTDKSEAMAKFIETWAKHTGLHIGCKI